MATQTVEDTTTTTTAQPAVRVDADPTSLLLDHNVRLSTEADKTLVESIRDHGVLQPITAVRTTDGGLRVRYGHRRTLAAISAGLTTVPVDVIGDEDDDQVARIVTQWAENEHRAGLTVADQIAAVEQLAAFGLSAAQITKRTKAKRADVDDALAASGSLLAVKAADRYDFLDLHHAAALAEFDGDDEATKSLVAAAKSGQFDHTAQRLRDERNREQANAAFATSLTEAGVRVVAQPGYNDKTVQRLDYLRDDDGVFTAERHAQCPGHAAYVTTGHGWVQADGQPVTDDPDVIEDDDAYEDDEDDDAETGDDGQVWAEFPLAVYVCTQPGDHQPRYASSNSSGTATSTGGGMTDEQKAERRLLIARNKEWKSAQTVRRDALRTLVTRKTPPKGTVTFIAAAFARGDWTLEKILRDGADLAADLLNTDTKGGRRTALTTAVRETTEARATVVLLAMVLACYEHATTMQTWRNPARGCADYLEFLAANGYTLADVERLVTQPDSAE